MVEFQALGDHNLSEMILLNLNNLARNLLYLMSGKTDDINNHLTAEPP